MKKLIASTIPMFFMHILCCGAVLYFLMTSGYLLVIRQEGNSKIWFIPLIVSTVVLVTLITVYRKRTKKDGCCTVTQNVIHFGMSCLVFLLLSILFMVYFFIPWWIPNYRGGFLLP